MHRRRLSFKSIFLLWIRNAGLWRGDHDRDTHWKAKIYIMCFMLTNMTQVIALFMAKDDPKKLFACFSVLSFCGMGVLKLASLLVNQHYWRVLINRASTLESEQLDKTNTECEYESDEEVDSSFSKHIDSYTENFLSISTVLSRIYSFTAVVYMLSPFLEYGFYVYQGKSVDEYPHILPGWAPLDVSLIGYFVTILAEAVAAVYCVRVHTAFDLAAVGLMIFVRGQFSLLHDYSERIGGRGNSCLISKRRDKRAQYRIKRCHSIHVLLLKSVKELGSVIQTILGIYFFVATLTLCSVAVQLKWQLNAMQLISLLQYMGATLTQLFLFCHFGDAVFNESSIGLGEGPFGAACWCLSPRIRRQIALLGVGMARPCKIPAGPFNSLDLPSFIQIVRAAYSYYAVLRQTSE